MLLVEAGLYIGTVGDLSDGARLASAAVTHVLSVDSADPAPLLPADARLRSKWVDVTDEPGSDLLGHMEDCYSFIQEAVSGGGAALVHCHAGRSRSAAIVTAYLMKRHRLSFSQAYERLKSVKPDVQMNSGFCEQLSVYESAQYDVGSSSAAYRQHRLRALTHKHGGLQCIPPELLAVDPHHCSSAEASYRCRKCRRSLFRASSIVSHTAGGGASAFSQRKPSHVSDEVRCTSFFIEPVQWMEEALLGAMDGQLLCPRCGCKLGSFKWCGDQCSCGRWVTPAFQLHRSKVDEIRQLSGPR